MARNIEIKARIPSAESLEPMVAGLASEGPIEIRQDDTFFVCPSGRLKLRTFEDGKGELIFYRRSDEAGPKESFYLRVAVDQPDTMREVLGTAYGFAARVEKHRILYLAGRTRIHLDRVRGLGTFLELEVVLREDEQLADGEAEARRIMRLLAIDPSQLVELSYGDLLSQLREGDAASA